MKKWCVLLASVMLLSLSLVGCTSAPEDQEPFHSVWEVTIGDEVVAIESITAMTTVTFDATNKEKIHSYTGVRLSALLAQVGITDFKTLTLEAADGYSFEITKEEAMNDNSILAFAMDGVDLADSKTVPLMFVSTVTSTRAWVGQLKYIKVGE